MLTSVWFHMVSRRADNDTYPQDETFVVSLALAEMHLICASLAATLARTPKGTQLHAPYAELYDKLTQASLCPCDRGRV